MDVRELERKVELGRLSDFYGPLLTEHRQDLLRMYCEDDLSLAEIAQALSEAGQKVTRQGVYDAIVKAEKQLTEFERKLGHMARYDALRREAERCLFALAEGGGGIDRAKQALLRMTEL